MKFLSFMHHGKSGFGVVDGGGVVDLAAPHRELTGLRAAIADDRLGQLADESKGMDADLSLTDIEYLPTIPDPEKIICIGVNYGRRNEEYEDDSTSRYPSVFMRARESLVGHEQDILDPPESDQLDYEGEIVMIIGRQGRRIPEARAFEHVAGLSIMNEGSVRDYLRHAKFNVTQGKNFEKSGSLGPWLVTPDELDPGGPLRVITRVNGEERQNDTTDNLLFPFRYLISYLSVFFRLRPGDVIATGTPSGAGARFDPPRYLTDGDAVEVEVPGIGVLHNRIRAESV